MFVLGISLVSRQHIQKCTFKRTKKDLPSHCWALQRFLPWDGPLPPAYLHKPRYPAPLRPAFALLWHRGLCWWGNLDVQCKPGGMVCHALLCATCCDKKKKSKTIPALQIVNLLWGRHTDTRSRSLWGWKEDWLMKARVCSYHGLIIAWSNYKSMERLKKTPCASAVMECLQGASGSGGCPPQRNSYRELHIQESHWDEASGLTEMLGLALPLSGWCPFLCWVCKSSWQGCYRS